MPTIHWYFIQELGDSAYQQCLESVLIDSPIGRDCVAVIDEARADIAELDDNQAITKRLQDCAALCASIALGTDNQEDIYPGERQ
jgi:hypothetical protein